MASFLVNSPSRQSRRPVKVTKVRLGFNWGKKKLMVKYSTQETSIAPQYCTLWFTKKLSKLRF